MIVRLDRSWLLRQKNMINIKDHAKGRSKARKNLEFYCRSAGTSQALCDEGGTFMKDEGGTFMKNEVRKTTDHILLYSRR